MTSRRQRARVDRRNQHRLEAIARASTVADRAAVEWDLTRGAIRRLPDDSQNDAWMAVTAVLTDFRAGLAEPPVPAARRGSDGSRASGDGEVHDFTSHRERGVLSALRPGARGRARARGPSVTGATEGGQA